MNRDEYQQPGPPQAGGPPHNGFFVDGVVVRDPYNGERFAGFTVREGDKLYWDVIAWEDGNAIVASRALRGGDLVHVEGRLAKRKNKKTNEWEISLVAEKLGVVGRAPDAGPPQQPQYQPPPQQPQPPGYGYQQNPAGAANYAHPQGQRRGQHPDAADWNQQGPQGPTWGQR